MIAGYKTCWALSSSYGKKFDTKLEGYKKGKGSVQFPIDKPLPKELIIEMVKYRFSIISKD